MDDLGSGQIASPAGGAGDSFGFEGAEDRVARDAEFDRIEAEHEEVITVARSEERSLLRMDARQFRNARGEVLPILIPPFRLSL